MADQIQKNQGRRAPSWHAFKAPTAEWTALIEKIQAEKSRREWESGGQVAAAVQKFALGRDSVGNSVEIIAISVGGRKHQYRTTCLPTIDPQSIGIEIEEEVGSGDILAALQRDGAAAASRLICDVETLRVSGPEREQLSSILWKYILDNRDDTRHDVLVAVGSAIRKYMGMLDVSRINEIASLLEAGHRAPLSLDLELEVVKMVYRKFEANPPVRPNTEPVLTARLWEMAQDYMRPRFILRDKYATVASLAIEAIVASRGSESTDAIKAALSSPFTWFTEMVTDDLERLVSRWRVKNSEAADWCEAVIHNVRGNLGGEAHAGKARY